MDITPITATPDGSLLVVALTRTEAEATVRRPEVAQVCVRREAVVQQVGNITSEGGN